MLKPVTFVVCFLSLMVGNGYAQTNSAQSVGNLQTGNIIRYNTRHHPVYARHGMVVSQNEFASRAGLEILQQGGNAVDAAVAVGLALAVTLPRAGNLGGGGFMLVYNSESKDTQALDFRSTAPAAARPEQYVTENGKLNRSKIRNSSAAAATPGTVAGLYSAHQQYGRLPWKQVVQPAIALAKGGFKVSYDLAAVLYSVKDQMSVSQGSLDAFYPRGQSPGPGTVFKQVDLAWSLEQLAESGADAFYKGPIGDRIVHFMQASGGLITAEDLKAYRVRQTAPLSTDYRGYTVMTMPPPSAGVIILQMLNMLECFPVADMPLGSASQIHRYAETMKWAFADRIQYLEDPAFVKVPTKGLGSKEYARKLCDRIRKNRATPAKRIARTDPWPFDSRDTTHYSVVDADGNGVSTTYTLGSSFGAGVTVPGTGIVLNNQMRNFVIPGTEDTKDVMTRFRLLKPGKRMLSTMSPIMVFRDDQLYVVTGSPGGHRIPSVNLQIITHILDYGLNPATATQAPRVHHNFVNDVLRYEEGVSPDTIRLLEQMGHKTQLEPSMGSTQTIVINNGLSGAADQRRPGALAVGY